MLGLGSTSQLGIGIAIRLHDQFSSQAAKVNQQLLLMRKNSTSALVGAMQNYRNNAMMISAAATGVSVGMYRMVDAAAEYDHIINQISIVGGKNLGKTRAELSAFAQDMSSIFPNNPKQIAGAMFENVKAGITTGLDLITKYQIAVSTATNEALEGEQGVAAGLLGIMNAMDLSTSQFPRVANAVSQAANISMASVFSLNESMQYFANTAHLAGLNLEETLALVSRLSQANIKGSIGGTALSNMIRHATSSVGTFQSPKNQKAWKALGVDSNQIAGLINQGRWFDLIDTVDKATKGMDRTNKITILDQIFGVRGNKALVNMFGNADPTKTFRSMYDSIRAGVKEDISMKQANAMSNDPWADIRKIGNAISRFGIQFLNAARPTLRVLLGITTKVIGIANTVLSTGVGKIFAGLALVGAPLIAILFAFRATVLAATIALRGFAATSAVGGFGGLFRAGLGSIGIAGMGKYGGAFTRNSLGRLSVAKGQAINFGGKLYKGGQILPTAFGAALGISSVRTGTALTGFLGKAASWGSKALGVFGRFLPAVGGIFLVADILQSIYSLNKAQKGKRDQLYADGTILGDFQYNVNKQLFEMSQNKQLKDLYGFNLGTTTPTLMRQAPVLNQTVNLNLGGEIRTINLQQQLSKDLANTLDFEMPPGF